MIYFETQTLLQAPFRLGSFNLLCKLYLHPSGTRTRSQEVNYRPKLFHQLVRHHNSVPMQVELCSLTWARVFAYKSTIFPRGKWRLGEKLLLVSSRLSCMNPSQPQNWRASESLLVLHAHQMRLGVSSWDLCCPLQKSNTQ